MASQVSRVRQVRREKMALLAPKEILDFRDLMEPQDLKDKMAHKELKVILDQMMKYWALSTQLRTEGVR